MPGDEMQFELLLNEFKIYLKKGGGYCSPLVVKQLLSIWFHYSPWTLSCPGAGEETGSWKQFLQPLTSTIRMLVAGLLVLGF